MKIEKDKPLPDHTKLDYDECCALLTLKELFPEQYSELILDDKPDLQGREVGIEVTIAGDRKHQEALSNWVKAYHSEDIDIKKKHVERMEQLGVKYTGGVQAWPDYAPSFSDVREAVKKKINKLEKGGYKQFARYELFVFSDAWMYDGRVLEARKFFSNDHVYDYYSKIYVFEQGYKLHIFEGNDYHVITIDISEQSERNIRARMMVEEAEKQD